MTIPEMPQMPQMQQAISRLRLLLASARAKEDELDALVHVSSAGSLSARRDMRYTAETPLKLH